MKKWFAYPYVIWSFIFIVIPLMLMVFLSLTIETAEGVKFSLANFEKFFNPLYIDVLIRSLKLAGLATLICLIIGYPAAYILSTMKGSKKNKYLLLIILPMWMNFLLRTYAWMTILGNNGIINNILVSLGFERMQLMYNNQAVVLGMVYNFIPFMILPIFTVLSKMDKSLVEAATDLGASKMTVFRKVTLPLSMPGVLTGVAMVFMPAVTTFVIPNLLGGGQYMLIGNLIEQQFRVVSDWRFGAAVSIIMAIIILITMFIMNKYGGADKEGERGIW